MNARPPPGQFDQPPGNPLMQGILREVLGVLKGPVCQSAMGTDELNIAVIAMLSATLSKTSGLNPGSLRRERTLEHIQRSINKALDISVRGGLR